MRTSVGLDISKKTIDAAYMPAESQITSAVFTNDADGIQSLKQWLDAFGQSDLHICMEATGNYYEAAADALSNDYAVYVVNPLKIKSYAKKRFSRTKTDKQDAKIIAEYCFTALDAELEQRHTPSADQYRIKRLMALHGQLKQQMTAQQNRLKAAKDKFVQSIHKEQIAGRWLRRKRSPSSPPAPPGRSHRRRGPARHVPHRPRPTDWRPCRFPRDAAGWPPTARTSSGRAGWWRGRRSRVALMSTR